MNLNPEDLTKIRRLNSRKRRPLTTKEKQASSRFVRVKKPHDADALALLNSLEFTRVKARHTFPVLHDRT